MEFRKEFAFLSNMSDSIIVWNNLYFSCVESAYQASKTNSRSEAEKFQSMTGSEAKKHSKVITVRKNWNDIKYDIMAQLVFQKFLIHKDLREKLLNTGDIYLEETNSWNDTYWGVCKGIGENNLGKILMNTREYFKHDSKSKR
jgi:ribA/ribD-fused uncharacterized protein